MNEATFQHIRKAQSSLGPKRAGVVDSGDGRGPKPWWTNGRVMFLGKLKGVPPQEKMQVVFDEATKEKGTWRELVPLAFASIVTTPDDRPIRCARLESEDEQVAVAIDERYFDYAREKEFAFYAGGPLEGERYVVCKKNGSIVGIIAPVRSWRCSS